MSYDAESFKAGFALGRILWKPPLIQKPPYLTFSSDNPFTLKTKGKFWDGTVEYSTDKSTWTTWDGSSLSSNNKNELYLRGSNNLSFATSKYSTNFVLTATSGVACKGNIENLLDYQTVLSGQHPVMWGNSFKSLFEGCDSLTSAPELPALTLYSTINNGCYRQMFAGCTSLKTAPKLPATTLAPNCYERMFYECTSLTVAPALPATTLPMECYYHMFSGCTSLVEAPQLPATVLDDACYAYMFYGCTSLTTAPKLPATTLANGCYNGMFYRCTSLITLPELPATTLPQYCYSSMFRYCSSIKLSVTQTSEYTIPYRIPTTGTGTSGTNSLNSMFWNTGGTFTSTPEINTTYYIKMN